MRIVLFTEDAAAAGWVAERSVRCFRKKDDRSNA